MYDIDKSTSEHVWFKLRSIPHVQFCGAYVAPDANDSGLPQIQAKMNYNSTRWGDSVEQLIEQQPGPSFCAIDRYINAKGSVGTLKCLF